MSRVLAIGDLHCPFDKKDYLKFLKQVRKDWRTDKVVFVGDELDFHAVSFHPKEPDARGAIEEYKEGIAHLKPFYKAFPEAMVCESNHTARPFRLAASVGVPGLFIKAYREFMQAPKGWKWADSWEVDGVMYTHGEGFSGDYPHVTAAKQDRMSRVIGHIHHCGGVEWLASFNDRIFGLSTGCGVDRKAYAFRYGKNHPKKPCIGCGVILDGREAYFVPMEMGTRIVRIR